MNHNPFHLFCPIPESRIARTNAFMYVCTRTFSRGKLISADWSKTFPRSCNQPRSALDSVQQRTGAEKQHRVIPQRPLVRSPWLSFRYQFSTPHCIAPSLCKFESRTRHNKSAPQRAAEDSHLCRFVAPPIPVRPSSTGTTTTPALFKLMF